MDEVKVEKVNVLDDTKINLNPTQEDPFLLGPVWIDPPLAVPPAGTPYCSECGCVFQTYSALGKHQGKPCHLDPSLSVEGTSPIVRVVVAEKYQALVGVREKSVDQRMAVLEKRRLHTKLLTKYNLEAYYDVIKTHTAASAWIALQPDDVTLLLRLCGLAKSRAMGMVTRETQQEAAGREALEDKVGALIRELGGRAFVKLSTRSPKDAIKTQGGSLMVTSGEQALSLICKSERCFNDLGLVSRYGDGELSIIVRAFDDRVDPQLEFRCVVLGDCLVSISQYNCYSAYDVLQDEARLKSIGTSIVRIWREVHPALRALYDEYVIDFAATPEGGTASIIEINPCSSSGIGLFSWKEPMFSTTTKLEQEGVRPVLRVRRAKE